MAKKKTMQETSDIENSITNIVNSIVADKIITAGHKKVGMQGAEFMADFLTAILHNYANPFVDKSEYFAKSDEKQWFKRKASDIHGLLDKGGSKARAELEGLIDTYKMIRDDENAKKLSENVTRLSVKQGDADSMSEHIDTLAFYCHSNIFSKNKNQSLSFMAGILRAIRKNEIQVFLEEALKEKETHIPECQKKAEEIAGYLQGQSKNQCEQTLRKLETSYATKLGAITYG